MTNAHDSQVYQLKNQSLSNYKTELSRLQTTCDHIQDAIIDLNQTRQKTVGSLKDVNTIINTLTNTPRDIEVRIHEISVSVTSLQPVEDLSRLALNEYIDATKKLFRGIGLGWVDVSKGTRADKVWGWVIIAIHTFLSVGKLYEANTELAKKAKSLTKKALDERARLQIYLNKIKVLETEIKRMNKHLSSQVVCLNGYRFANYQNLNYEEKVYLGEIVNEALTLSHLLKETVESGGITDE